MNKNKYLFGLIGLVIGFMLSFFITQSLNRSGAVTGAQPAVSGGGAQPGGPSQQAMMASVRETLEKAKNNPNDFEAQVNAARQFVQVNQVDKSVEYLKRAFEINPAEAGNLGIPPFIGQYYFQEKNYVESEKWFREALKSEKEKGPVYVEIGSTYILRNPPDPDSAITNLQAALELDSKDGHALGHMVEAYLLKKNASEAENILNRLKEAEPGNKRISLYQNLLADLKAGKPVTIPGE